MESDYDSCSNLESEDEELYCQSDSSSLDPEFIDSEVEESDDETLFHGERKDYVVLEVKDICDRQDDNIATVSSLLSLTREEASVLLRWYNWDVTRVPEEWFANEEGVRKKVGLLVQEKGGVRIENGKRELCQICFESSTLDGMTSAACGHLFCRDCYKSYISTSIKDGSGCLLLRCPEPRCPVAVGEDMIRMLASDEEKVKYECYLMRSYVETSKTIKWCPGPDCESAVEYVGGSGKYDVSCSCSYSFCWNCRDEPHRPVDCNTVAKWVLKNNSEGESAIWMLANTKPCPKCGHPIQRNSGCMHMTCRCRFEFCWLCLGRWDKHGDNTGGFYSCNTYLRERDEGLTTEEEMRENAKKSSQKFLHYYERWSANDASRRQALQDLEELQPDYLARLSDMYNQTEAELRFITEAWLQIIECRRLLKWTYAYGYYLPENEGTKKQFFEYLQGQAESTLERLHECAEKDVKTCFDPKSASVNFNDLRAKLMDLTVVTRNHFGNLGRALENDLTDVVSVNPSTSINTVRNESSKIGLDQKVAVPIQEEDEIEAKVAGLNFL